MKVYASRMTFTALAPECFLQLSEPEAAFSTPLDKIQPVLFLVVLIVASLRHLLLLRVSGHLHLRHIYDRSVRFTEMNLVTLWRFELQF